MRLIMHLKIWEKYQRIKAKIMVLLKVTTGAARNKLADKYLPKLRKAVQDAIKSELAAKTPSKDRLAKKLFNARRPFILEMTFKGRKLTADQIAARKRKQYDEDEFFLSQYVGDIDEWLAEVCAKSANTMTLRWRERIKKLEEDAANEKIKYTDIAKIFMEEGIYDSEVDALRTARTDTIWSMNEGAEEAYKEAGVETKEWDSSSDESVCPLCAELSGVQVGIDDPFLAAGETLSAVNEKGKTVSMTLEWDVFHPPLHPRCRCAELAVF